MDFSSSVCCGAAGFSPPIGGLKAAAPLPNSFTSLATILPCGPLPWIASRLTPNELAILRASGDERRRDVSVCGMATTFVFCACVRSMRGAFISIASAYSPVVCLIESFLSMTRRCCGSVFAGAPLFSPAPRIVANRSPTGTICPSWTDTSPSVPSCSASRSRFTLSVSISSSGSPFLTASPAFLYQRMTFPSVMASPILGMMISMNSGPIHDPFHSFDDMLFVRSSQ